MNKKEKGVFNCLNCTHIDVCRAFGRIEKVLLNENCFQDEFGAGQPTSGVFQAVAKLCEKYKEKEYG